MALDNIQKSILTVLGISGMVAFLTPAGITPLQGDDVSTSEVSVKSEPPVLVAPPPKADTELQFSDSTSGNQMPAFGEPTMSGLPYGQEPATKSNNADDPDSSVNNIADNGNNNSNSTNVPEGTVLPSGGVMKNGEVVF